MDKVQSTMKFLFKLLLFVFTAVSAYVTFTLTISLANDFVQEIAFSILGIAFDVLKCFLPATFLMCFARREWGKGLTTLAAYVCLTAFSFYASMQLFEASTNRKIEERVKATVSYTTLQTQLNNYQKSYDRLVELDRITKANAEYGDKIKDTAGQMTALIDYAKANKVQSLADLLMTIVVSILLEISVLSCHISIAIRDKKVAQAETKAVQDEAEVGQNEASQASNANVSHLESETEARQEDDEAVQVEPEVGQVDTRIAISKDELEALLKSGVIAPSARAIAAKYQFSRSTADRVIKKVKAQEQEQAKAQETESTLKNDVPTSNIILLPTYKN